MMTATRGYGSQNHSLEAPVTLSENLSHRDTMYHPSDFVRYQIEFSFLICYIPEVQTLRNSPRCECIPLPQRPSPPLTYFGMSSPRKIRLSRPQQDASRHRSRFAPPAEAPTPGTKTSTTRRALVNLIPSCRDRTSNQYNSVRTPRHGKRTKHTAPFIVLCNVYNPDDRPRCTTDSAKVL